MMPTMMELSLFTSNTSFIMSFNKKVIKGDKHTRANFLGDVLGYIAEYGAFEGVGRIGSVFKIPKVGNTMSKIWGSSKFESMARMPKVVAEQYAKNLIPGMVPADVGGSLKGGFDFSGFMQGSLSEIKDTLKSAWSNNKGQADASKWSSEKGIYSVAYEVNLPKDMYPGVSDAKHFQEANRQLYNAFQSDASFAQSMEELYPGIIDGVKPGKRGAFPRQAPTKDVSWNHEANREGVLQLIPREQHQAKGLIQSIFHPNGRGGMQNWGGGR
ncbi:MAG: hypothetical protein Q8936_23975, partial [Bacillota bacterium]|nr:hypothetical protein [Bacillota bacterium]